jgi:hypothetical protein
MSDIRLGSRKAVASLPLRILAIVRVASLMRPDWLKIEWPSAKLVFSTNTDGNHATTSVAAISIVYIESRNQQPNLFGLYGSTGSGERPWTITKRRLP